MKNFLRLHGLDGDVILMRTQTVMVVSPGFAPGINGGPKGPCTHLYTLGGPGIWMVKESVEQIEAMLEENAGEDWKKE